MMDSGLSSRFPGPFAEGLICELSADSQTTSGPSLSTAVSGPFDFDPVKASWNQWQSPRPAGSGPLIRFGPRC